MSPAKFIEGPRGITEVEVGVCLVSQKKKKKRNCVSRSCFIGMREMDVDIVTHA